MTDEFSGFLRNTIEAANESFAAGAQGARVNYAREKRGYAKRLRDMFEGVELEWSRHDLLRQLIADLERDL